MSVVLRPIGLARRRGLVVLSPASMPSRYVHAVIADPQRGLVLSAGAPSHWLIPYVDFPPHHERMGHVKSLLRRLTIDGVVLHEAALVDDGHLNRQHWYALVIADAGHTPPSWTWSDAARLDETRALWPIQGSVLALCLRRMRQPNAPYDAPAIFEEALDWARQSYNREGTTPRMVQYTARRHGFVVTLETTTRLAVFKAGPTRIQEGQLNDHLRASSPADFSPTIALDESRALWLTLAQRGEMAAHCSALTSERQEPTLCAIARALARVQRLSATTVGGAAIPGTASLTTSALRRTLDCALARTDARTLLETTPTRLIDDLSHSVSYACDAMESCVPIVAWLHGGLRPTNVLIDGHDVRFIDLEHSYCGPPPIALFSLIRYFAHSFTVSDSTIAKMAQEYLNEWNTVTNTSHWRELLRAAPLLATVFHMFIRMQKSDHDALDNDGCRDDTGFVPLVTRALRDADGIRSSRSPRV